MSRRTRRGTVAIATLLLLLHAAPARAQEQREREVLSESLFSEGKRLMNEKQFPAACGKFEESQRLDPAGGTQFALAVCYEQAGLVASAWLMFGEAMATAIRDQRPDRIALSREHRATLEPRLPHVRLHLANPQEGLTPSLDGVPLSSNTWDVAIPLNPGRHLVRVTAESYRPHEQAFEANEGLTTDLSIPELTRDPDAEVRTEDLTPPATPEPVRATAPSTNWARVAGWSALAVGAGALAFGGYSGFQAFAKNNDAGKSCDDRGCDDRGLQLIEQGHAAATRADVAIGVGLVAIAAGVVLLVFQHRPPFAPSALRRSRWEARF